MRAKLLAAAGVTLVLAGCDMAGDDPETVAVRLDQPAPGATQTATVDDNGATPMAERTATLGLLNKRNNVTEEITLKPGETRETGPVIIRLSACERTGPWELPQEVGAFVQVDIQDRGQPRHARVFSGWLFRESPSLNVVEHPIYDVWVKDCTMRFPGEEASAAPDPAPSPSPTPTPRAATTG